MGRRSSVLLLSRGKEDNWYTTQATGASLTCPTIQMICSDSLLPSTTGSTNPHFPRLRSRGREHFVLAVRLLFWYRPEPLSSHPVLLHATSLKVSTAQIPYGRLARREGLDLVQSKVRDSLLDQSNSPHSHAVMLLVRRRFWPPSLAGSQAGHEGHSRRRYVCSRIAERSG